MPVKYATLWLFTLPLSPCNLYVQFSRLSSPEGNGRTADNLDVHTTTIILEH